MKNQEWFHRPANFLVFLILGLLVFLVFSHFQPLLPKTIDLWARIILSVVLLAGTLLARRCERLKRYWPMLFAFFVAAFAMALDLYLSHWSLGLLNITVNTPIGHAIDKLESTLIVVATIVILTKLSGDDMSSLYFKKGNLKSGITIGLVVFAVFVVVAIPLAELQFQGRNLSVRGVIPWIPWVFLFVLANAINEELLFRGLFLRKLQPFLGKFGANLLVAIVFTLMHVGVDYTPDVFLFLGMLLPLGLVLGYVMQKTDSIWGSVLIHAAIDIPVVLGLFSNLP